MELIPSFAAFRFRTFVGRLRSARSNFHAATFIREAVEPESCPLSVTPAKSWYVLRSATRVLLASSRWKPTQPHQTNLLRKKNSA
jgi:hypothetical protein